VSKYPQVEVVLSGTDGNAGAIMGRVRRAIKRQVGEKEAQLFVDAFWETNGYDEVLRLAMDWVEVS